MDILLADRAEGPIAARDAWGTWGRRNGSNFRAGWIAHDKGNLPRPQAPGRAVRSGPVTAPAPARLPQQPRRVALLEQQADGLLVERHKGFPAPPRALLGDHSVRKITAGLEYP